MHPVAARLLDAHTAHILAQLAGDNLDATLDREAGAFLDWLDARPLNSLVDAERVFTLARERILESDPTPALTAEIVAIVKDIWNSTSITPTSSTTSPAATSCATTSSMRLSAIRSMAACCRMSSMTPSATTCSTTR